MSNFIVYKKPAWSVDEVVWQKAHVGYLPTKDMAEQFVEQIKKTRTISGEKVVPMLTKIEEFSETETSSPNSLDKDKSQS